MLHCSACSDPCEASESASHCGKKLGERCGANAHAATDSAASGATKSSPRKSGTQGLLGRQGSLNWVDAAPGGGAYGGSRWVLGQSLVMSDDSPTMNAPTAISSIPCQW